MTTKTQVKKIKSKYICARCGKPLFTSGADGSTRWIHSSHTGSRYCWPGEGCNR